MNMHRLTLNVTTEVTIFIILFLLGSLTAQTTDFNPLCGDCWCIPDGGTINGTCPEFVEGLWQEFPSTWDPLYRSMTMNEETSDIFVLQTSEGSTNCFPFSEAIGQSIDDFVESAFPQCTRPTGYDNPNAVCAFTFTSGQNCDGRDYSVNTFENATAALDAGAIIAHSGPCAACSSAQDLATRIANIGILNQKSIFCSARYAVDPNSNFTELIACYEEIGFSFQCARTWAVRTGSYNPYAIRPTFYHLSHV
jgi:hypothetical protein